MAEGDMCSGSVQLISGASTLIKPPTTDIEWVIHNIYIPQGFAVQLYHYYNTSPVQEISLMSTTQSLCGYCFHCNNNSCIKIVNNSGSTIYIGYDGVETSE